MLSKHTTEQARSVSFSPVQGMKFCTRAPKKKNPLQTEGMQLV